MWEKIANQAEELHITRAKIQAGSKNRIPNSDFLLKHPDEVRDMATGKFTLLEMRIKKEHQKYHERINIKREKIGKRRN